MCMCLCVCALRILLFYLFMSCSISIAMPMFVCVRKHFYIFNMLHWVHIHKMMTLTSIVSSMMMMTTMRITNCRYLFSFVCISFALYFVPAFVGSFFLFCFCFFYLFLFLIFFSVSNFSVDTFLCWRCSMAGLMLSLLTSAQVTAFSPIARTGRRRHA